MNEIASCTETRQCRQSEEMLNNMLFGGYGNGT
jgi:hypothetical protein